MKYKAQYQTRANSPFKTIDHVADEIVVTGTEGKPDEICIIGWNHTDDPNLGLVFRHPVSGFDTAKVIITVATDAA